MKRHMMAIATSVALLVAGIVSAAPKTESAAKGEEKTCVRGEGREFVDKNASLYVSECEVGNGGFHTASAKSKSVKNAGFASSSCCAVEGKSAKVVKAAAEECAPGASCCEVGNAGFFHNATCCGGQHAKMHGGKKTKSEKKAKESASR